MHIANSLDRLACLTAAQEQAKVLCSRSQASLVSGMLDPGRQAEHEQLLAQVWAELGEVAFAAAPPTVALALNSRCQLWCTSLAIFRVSFVVSSQPTLTDYGQSNLSAKLVIPSYGRYALKRP